jgi:hypothetical protein
MSLDLIEECRNSDLAALSKWKKAIKLAELDDSGFGYLLASDLPEELRTINGKTWARQAEKHFVIEYERGENNKVIAYDFRGFCSNDDYCPAPDAIKKIINKQRCVVLGTHANVETDHKNRDHFYDDLEFKNNIDHYQPFAKVVNAKKREEKRKREESGYKFDNTIVGCAFITAKFSLKDDESNYTKNDPYDGDFWTDPVKTQLLDRRLYAEYFILCKESFPDLTFFVFEKRIIPLINNTIKDNYNVQGIDKVFSFIKNKILFV